MKSLAAEPLLPALDRANPQHALASAARLALHGFDGTMAVDRAAPLIFWAFTRQLARGVFGDELGG